MKNLQLTDEIKLAFESVKLPEIDVSDAVIDSIRSSGVRCSKRKIRLVYTVLAAVLLITATAYTAARIWVIRDSNNNIILRYRGFDEENYEPFDICEDSEFQKQYENLEPGKALVYYNASVQKPNSESLTMYPKPVVYTDLDLVREKSCIDFKVPSALPAGYTFSEGRLSFEPVGAKDHEIFKELLKKLKEEAEKTGKNSVALEWETTSKVTGISLVYRNNDREFRVDISVWLGEDLYTDLSDSSVEVITVDDREILYIEENDGDRKIILREMYGKDTVKRFEKGKYTEEVVNAYLQYSVVSKDLSKEDLILVAQGIIR